MTEQNESSEEHPLSSLGSISTDAREILATKLGITSVEALFGYLTFDDTRGQVRSLLGISSEEIEALMDQCVEVIGEVKASKIRQTKPWIGPLGLVADSEEADDE